MGAARGRRGAVREGRAGAPSVAERGARRRANGSRARSRGWVGRVTAGRLDGAGHFILDTIAGELERRARRAGRRPRRPPVAAVHARGGRRRCWRPRAPGWTRARCAALPACRWTWSRRRPALILVEGYGEPRFRLDINWDPDTLPAFLELPACEAHGRTVPVDPYLLEPLEHYLRTYNVEPAANAARGAGPPAPRARRRDRRRAPLARPRAATRCPNEDRLGGELQPFQRAGVALRAARAAHLPGRRAGARQDDRGARRAGGRRRLPRRGRLPRRASSSTGAARSSAGCPTAALTVDLRAPASSPARPTSRSSTTRSSTPTACGSRCAGPRRWCSTSPTTSRTRAPSAPRPCGGWPRRCPTTRSSWPSPARRS